MYAPKRAVEVEGFALERGSETDSQLQLIDIAFEDSPLHLRDQLQVAFAIERRRDRTRRAQRFGKRRLGCEQPPDVAVDPALERIDIVSARPNRQQIGEVIEDQPRRRNRNVGSRHRRFRRGLGRQTRIGPRSVVRKREQGTAERTAGRRDAMLRNEGAHARI